MCSHRPNDKTLSRLTGKFFLTKFANKVYKTPDIVSAGNAFNSG
jgi:hypothetical protein